MKTNTEYAKDAADRLAPVVEYGTPRTALNAWIVAVVSNRVSPEQWQEYVDLAEGYVREFKG